MAGRPPPLMGLLALAGSALVLLGVSFTFGALAAVSTTFEGRYVLRHTDDFAGKKARFTPMVELADGTLLELDYGRNHAPSVNAGSTVRVSGTRRGGRLLVAAGGTQTTGGPATTTSTGTAKRVAVVLFTFSNVTTQPYSPAQAAGVAFTNSNSVAAYYAASTWGSVAMTGDVYGWYAIPDSNTSCNYSTWASSANAAAAAAGVNLNAYDHVVYGFPSTSSCGWGGLAYMPGRTSWLNGSGGMSLRVMSHELGHNFGTNHASTLNCTESGVRVSISATTSNCSLNEYGDPFTVMGASSSARHTSFSLANFGWLPAARTLTVTATGDYTLAPLYAVDGVQSIQLQRSSGSYLTLELRQPGSPFDTFSITDPAVNGVTVRITGSYPSRSWTQLVDSTPATSSFVDAPLAPGKTLVDPLSGVSITTVSASSSGAVVRIAWGAPPPTSDTSPPAQPGSLNATALDASRVSLTWSASTDNVGVAGYRVYRNTALIATVTGTSYTDSGLAPSTAYAYQVVAVDAAGNTSTPASASATTPGTDTQPPSAPTNLVVTPGTGKKLTLSWTASTDNVEVAGYRVFRDSKLIGQTTATSYGDTLRGKSTTATYTVVAFDAAGNVSPASAPLTTP